MVGDPGELTNQFNPQFIQFFRWSDIPNPAEIYVFLDEHPDTINDGFFMNRWEIYSWGNLPASYHNGAANLSFADGHMESHRWALEETRRPPEKGGVGGTFEPLGHTDFDWLKERTSVRKN
jgi:prepilin-type processing-associated H-X9-DG protein